LAKPENVLHVEEPSFLVSKPPSRPYRTLRKGVSVGCLMCDLDAFTIGGEPNTMFAHNITGTDGLKTDGLTPTRASVALAAINSDLAKIPA